MSYHRTVMVIEVLGNTPFDGDLDTVSEATMSGDFSGAVLTTTTTEVTAEQMAALLEMQGSDPCFLVEPEENA